MLKKIIIGIVLIVLFAELFLRFVLGFGDLPLYVKSMEFEYIFAADQNVKRFHNRIRTNEFSMRSKPLKEGETRIFKFGDSVLNGGVNTDHEELSSTLLENSIQQNFKDSLLRVLNVSAGSWGPDNAFAWLSSNPDFDPALIILVFGSEDWYDYMNFQDVVGNQPNYPEEKPFSAISDAFSWIYTRYIQDFNWNELAYIKNVNNDNFDHNPGWDHFIEYSTENDIDLWVYHYPNKEENQNQAYNRKGQQLQQYLKNNNVFVISGIDAGLSESDFQDEIHPTSSGQVKIAEAIKPHLIQWIGGR